MKKSKSSFALNNQGFALNAGARTCPKQCRSTPGIFSQGFIVIVLFIAVQLFSFNSNAQQTYEQILERQVVVLKTDANGLIVTASINQSNGIIDFYKRSSTGVQSNFGNLKEVLDYMAIFGYSLTFSNQLSAYAEADMFIHSQYIFERKKEGKYKNLII